MIAQFRMLTAVKRLREDKALRALEAARAAVIKAREKAERLAAEVEDSARTLPAREAALYDAILTRVVGLGAVDDVKTEVLALLEEHRNLTDRLERAREYVRRCEAKLTEARTDLRRRQADVEKIETITGDLVRKAAEAAVANEEAEIEDLFGRPIRSPAMAATSDPEGGSAR